MDVDREVVSYCNCVEIKLIGALEAHLAALKQGGKLALTACCERAADSLMGDVGDVYVAMRLLCFLGEFGSFRTLRGRHETSRSIRRRTRTDLRGCFGMSV